MTIPQEFSKSVAKDFRDLGRSETCLSRGMEPCPQNPEMLGILVKSWVHQTRGGKQFQSQRSWVLTKLKSQCIRLRIYKLF